MFTGLVHGDAHIQKISQLKDTISMTVSCTPAFLTGIKLGDSIAVDGCCLTVEKFGTGSFTVTMMPQTFHKTIFKKCQVGTQVNVERALKANSRLDGHLVSGHVDDVVQLLKKEINENAVELTFALPARLIGQVVNQGSIAVNGTSLTVMRADNTSFAVGLIPHTQEETGLANLKVGDQVNIETDLVGKYVVHNLAKFQGAK